jgi:hypothetical protein
MKTSLKLLLTLAITVMFLLSACAPRNGGAPTPLAITATPLPHSMKGYELYSWQVDDQWHFTLVIGTNRVKSIEEIISNENMVTADGWVKISVQGADAIQTILSGLPPHEEIFWADSLAQGQNQANAITLPPQEIIDMVQEYCKQSGLELHVSK